MIKDLRDARLVDAVPRVVAGQDWVRALSEAVGVLHERTLRYIDDSQIYTSLDTATEPVLDALAINWKVDWYDTGYSVEQKRRIIKTALTVRRLMGTVGAVKLQADAIYPGTMLEEWLEGIWDLNGNVWEWCAGLRLVKGEVQVIADNNAAAPTCDMSASSAAWKAISAATGELVAPDGNGTTQGTVKLDFISGKWTYSTTIAHTTGANGCSFKDVTCDSSIGAAAKLLLQALAMLPDAALTGDGIDATYGGDYFYANNAEAERCLIRGGHGSGGGGAGVFGSSLNAPRSSASGYVGGRSAFYE